MLQLVRCKLLNFSIISHQSVDFTLNICRLRIHTCRHTSAAPRQPNPKREQRQSWTAEEDAIISQSVGEAGNRWSLIVTRLPNRTEHAIRNRWHRLQQMGAGAAGDAAVDASIAGALC